VTITEVQRISEILFETLPILCSSRSRDKDLIVPNLFVWGVQREEGEKYNGQVRETIGKRQK